MDLLRSRHKSFLELKVRRGFFWLDANNFSSPIIKLLHFVGLWLLNLLFLKFFVSPLIESLLEKVNLYVSLLLQGLHNLSRPHSLHFCC